MAISRQNLFWGCASQSSTCCVSCCVLAVELAPMGGNDSYSPSLRPGQVSFRLWAGGLLVFLSSFVTTVAWPRKLSSWPLKKPSRELPLRERAEKVVGGQETLFPLVNLLIPFGCFPALTRYWYNGSSTASFGGPGAALCSCPPLPAFAQTPCCQKQALQHFFQFCDNLPFQKSHFLL